MKFENTLQTLDAERINTTIQILRHRILERFPDSGLAGVCSQLLTIAQQSKERSEWIVRPIVSLRIAIALVIILFLLILIGSLLSFKMPTREVNLLEVIQLAEVATNDLVFVGIAVFFLASLETRIKRRRALSAIHELRVIAHLIDIRQLTKDPQWVLTEGQDTESSPRHGMTSFELSRYLDYCSEMLSLTGKVAVLYVQNWDDPYALEAVNDVEELTTSLSRKIWQKLMILNSMR